MRFVLKEGPSTREVEVLHGADADGRIHTVQELVVQLSKALGYSQVSDIKHLLTKRKADLMDPDRQRQPWQELAADGDLLMLFSRNASQVDVPLAKRPVLEEDIKTWLRMCSAVFVPQKPILQPYFAMTYFAEGDADAPIYPVCGPCAHTCWNMQHIHVLDDLAALETPFICQCCAIVKTDHCCFWKGTEPERDVHVAMERAWAEQQRKFVRPIREDLEAKRREEMAKKDEEMTQTVRRRVDLFEQYSDQAAQAAARSVVPTAWLTEQAKNNPIGGEKDFHDALLRQLLAWFKGSFFKWVTTPACETCEAVEAGSGETEADGQIHPNPEEVANWASVVEKYICKKCRSVVRFPRYNRAQRLLTWRRGRCGEWANCFCLLCIALGFETRFVEDMTDHVWVEVYSHAKKRWIHCDPCEDAFDAPLMYETGWKKDLNIIFAVGAVEVVDVVRRYSNRSCQLKRANIKMSSEPFFCGLIFGMNEAQRRRAPSARADFLQRRYEAELEELALERRFLSLEGETRSQMGRLTGSLEWRSSRGETGAGGSTAAQLVPMSSGSRLASGQVLRSLVLDASVVRDQEAVPFQWSEGIQGSSSAEGKDSGVLKLSAGSWIRSTSELVNFSKLHADEFKVAGGDESNPLPSLLYCSFKLSLTAEAPMSNQLLRRNEGGQFLMYSATLSIESMFQLTVSAIAQKKLDTERKGEEGSATHNLVRWIAVLTATPDPKYAKRAGGPAVRPPTCSKSITVNASPSHSNCTVTVRLDRLGACGVSIEVECAGSSSISVETGTMLPIYLFNTDQGCMVNLATLPPVSPASVEEGERTATNGAKPGSGSSSSSSSCSPVTQPAHCLALHYLELGELL
jgi:hypothetical protein